MAIRKSVPKANEIKMEIIENCGVIAERKGGYTLELRFISWNGGEGKYDIRPWKVNDDGTEICGKGITLSGEELEALGALIAGMIEAEES